MEPPPRLVPGTLWPAILRQTAHALACGALQPIDTQQSVLDSGGIRFLVRQVSSLARKEQQREQARKLQTVQTRQTQRIPKANPFLPYEADLFVADISATHLALLNKFNVIEHHLLIVTREFERQEALLDLADFDALIACMAEFDGIGFYNAGEEAGASQPHKHLQIVPLPLGDSGPPVPVEPLLGVAGRSPVLPFRHAFARLDVAGSTHAAAAKLALSRYHALLDAARVGTVERDGATCHATPYNLLVTRRWMLLVPRAAERVEGVSVNALGFAGSLFVRDAAQLAVIERLGPITALQRVALPANT
ncbi:phosphorylase [Burkholderia sp. SRS-W-2-2016]|uniref:ATP adenylyltransferase family protein n=1 Tax=Burkholderia sp. SRS-W-2-2016 TaxID=1926878 RepID=UPI00094B2FEF|nr:phosphorylase [Burkholderia sp. SRS-W-2-2016]OLL30918.1 phosphorylase [Burkholderia sp. SRS-W-2-2016]